MKTSWLLLLCSMNSLSAPIKGLGNAKFDECSSTKVTIQDVHEVAFMQSVLWALEPAPIEVRSIAIEDLGLIGDPRALNVLAQMATDLNPAISKAAIRAIGLIRHQRAEEILSNILRHPTLPEATKLEALKRLPFQNTWSAIRTIHFLARNVSGTTYLLNTQLRAMSSQLPRAPEFLPSGP